MLNSFIIKSVLISCILIKSIIDSGEWINYYPLFIHDAMICNKIYITLVKENQTLFQ